jgi:hypothetical protein
MATRARFILFLLAAASANAQSLARNVTSVDGSVQVLFPAPPNVCGDGESFIRTSSGRNATYSGSVNTREAWYNRPCVTGQGRALVSVINGEVARLSVYVGPVPSFAANTRTINAPAADATAWLIELANRAESRVASRAIQALSYVDAPTPWPAVLRIARSTERPQDVRRSAIMSLSFGVTDKLGLSDVDEHGSDDDEIRTQAVFVLSQRKKSESVPDLVDLVRTAKNPAVRKAAIFWLGQSGDPRAVEVYAELLAIK